MLYILIIAGVNICPFSLPHFASIFFAYLWSFRWPNYIVTLPRYFSFRLPHLNIPIGPPSDELDKNIPLPVCAGFFICIRNSQDQHLFFLNQLSPDRKWLYPFQWLKSRSGDVRWIFLSNTSEGGPVCIFKCGSRKEKYLGSVTI